VQQTEQEQQASAEIQQTMQKMLAEVKRQMKPNSKNELIRIIGALLVDNYALKMQLAEIHANAQPEQEKVENEQL
jgi:hypothetical protein